MADQKAQVTITAVDQTKAAFNSAKKNFEDLKTTADGLAAKFGSVGLAIAGVFEGITIKGAIDAADELSKLSQRTGITIEELSALKLGAELSNVSMEDLATGLKKLAVNMAAAAGGGKEAQATFDALGVKVTDTAGKVRSTDDVLGDLADKFASFKDGPVKAADAVAVFGKAGDRLIPFLNLGRDGIQKLREEAEKLGIVIGGDLGKQAEDFNDNLTRLKAAAQGAKLALASELLPTLNSTLEAFVENTKAAGLFKGALLTLGQGISARLGFDELGKLETQAKGTSAEIERVTNQMIGLSNTLDREPTNDAAKRRYENLRKTLTGLQADAAKTSDAIKNLANDKTKAATKPDAPKPTKDAPVINKAGDAAAAAALEKLKANLAKELDALKTGLEAEQDLYKFNETYVQALYQTGNTSLKAFFETQDALRDADLSARKKFLNDSIGDEEKFQRDLQALPKTPGGEKALIDSQKKVAAAKAAIAKADQDAVEQAAVTSVTRQKQLDDQKRALDVFNGQLADLVTGARDRAAELAEIAVKVDAAKDKLIQGGVDKGDANAQAEQLRAQLLAQRDFNLSRDEFTRITDKAKDAEEALLLVQQKNGAGLLEGERQVTALREQELQQLGKVLDATRALAAANPENETLIANLRQVELAYGKLAATADATKQRLDAAADSLGSGIAETLGRAVTEGGRLKDILNDVLKQIATSVTQEAIVKPLSTQFSNFIKGSGGQGAGENLLGLVTGQNKKSSAEASKLPGALSDGKSATVGVTDSLTNLKTVGVDPMTAALTNLTQAINATAASLGKPLGGEPLTIDNAGVGIDAAGHGFSAAKDGASTDTGEQSISDLFKNTGAQDAADANKNSAAASNAAANALLQLGSGASVANAALGLLPSILSAIAASAGGSSGGLGNLFGGLFGSRNVGGENIGGTTGGGTFSAASTYDSGGFTGNFGVNQPAGLVHGREFVMSAPAVETLGIGYLDNMHRAARAGKVRGYVDGGYVGAMPSGWNGRQAANAPVSVTIIQQFAPGATQKTTDQAASSAGRAAARAIGRGGA